MTKLPVRILATTVTILRSSLGRIAVMAGLWIVLTEARPGSWVLAFVVVGLASYASLHWIPPGAVRLHPGGVLRFLPFFFHFSIRGGIDVAYRAIRNPGVENAGLIAYRTVLPQGVPRYFFIAAIGLFPGSLAVRHERDRLQVHVLDRGAGVEDQLQALERRVADLFGIGIEGERGNG